jgi:hypothetical protein
VDAPDEFSLLLAKLVSMQLDATEVGFKGRLDAIVQQYVDLVSNVAVGCAKAEMHVLIAEVLDFKLHFHKRSSRMILEPSKVT